MGRSTFTNENGYEVHSGLFRDGSGIIHDIAKTLDGLDGSINSFSHLKVAEYTPLVELKPYPSISPLRNEIYEPGNASIGLGEGLIQIESPNASDKAEIYSRLRGRYLPGIIGIAGIGYSLNDTSDAVYEIGYFTDDEGFGLLYDQGTYKTFVRRGGNQYYERPREEWIDPLDGTGPSKIDFDPKRGVLRMPFVWYGFGTIEFYLVVSTRENGDETVLIDRAYAPSDGAIIYQPDLPLSVTCLNGQIGIGGRQYGVYGRYLPYQRINYYYTEKSIGNTFEPIVSVKTKDELRWRSVPIRVNNFTSITTDDIEWRISYNTVISKNGSDIPEDEWVDPVRVDPEDTAVQFNVTADSVDEGYPISGGLIGVSGTGTNAFGSASEHFPDINIPSGSVATLEMRALDSSADINATFSVSEEH